MVNFRKSDNVKPIPILQLMPLIDILFVNLAFFMAVFVYSRFESELNVSIPKSDAAVESRIGSDEIIINVLRNGEIIVNQRKLAADDLEVLLEKAAKLYPSQPVILRADEKTYHEFVVRVLDACARANIWNISFATTRER
jgi:biopolymer transport protein ExbD